MQIDISDNYQELSEKVADVVINLVKKKKNAVITFPSGDSPLGLLRCLVKKAKDGVVDFSSCHFVGLDEWVGMDISDEGSCQHFMYNEFFIPLGIHPDQITYFDARSNNLDRACKQVDEEVSKLGGIDLVVLGIGMNGHLGFNEPGVSEELYSHSIELDEVTKVVGQKYFPGKTLLTKGISLGLKQIMNSGEVILIANGAKKAPIIRQTVEGAIGNEVPASLMRRHPRATLYIDREAAQELTTNH